MKLVRLVDAAESQTPLGAFLGALMRDFKPEPFVMVIGRLERNLYHYQKDGCWSDARQAEVVKHLGTLAAECERFGLDVTATKVRRTLEYIESPPTGWVLAEEFKNILGTHRTDLYAEMSTMIYFDVPKDMVRLWNDDAPFGALVSTVFKDSAYDIQEACKCYVAERPSACVYHLMGAVEPALKLLCTKLSVTPSSATWGTILKELGEKKNKVCPDTKNPKDDFTFYSDVLFQLSAAKDAWRNHAAHCRESYTKGQAMDIFNGVRAAMTKIAERFPND